MFLSVLVCNISAGRYAGTIIEQDNEDTQEAVPRETCRDSNQNPMYACSADNNLYTSNTYG